MWSRFTSRLQEMRCVHGHGAAWLAALISISNRDYITVDLRPGVIRQSNTSDKLRLTEVLHSESYGKYTGEYQNRKTGETMLAGIINSVLFCL